MLKKLKMAWIGLLVAGATLLGTLGLAAPAMAYTDYYGTTKTITNVCSWYSDQGGYRRVVWVYNWRDYDWWEETWYGYRDGWQFWYGYYTYC